VEKEEIAQRESSGEYRGFFSVPTTEKKMQK
jgi:hypothetical protein